MSEPQIPIVCDLDTIPAEERKSHEARAKRLFYDRVFTDIRALDSGYEFAFPVAELANLAKYIENERLCCPFWDFRIQLAPRGEVVWLALTGGAGIKAMIEQDILPQIRESTE